MSNYLSVSSLTKYLKLKFDKDPYLERVYLTGQVSNFRKRPNHQYFSLKDEKAVIQATVWAGVYRSFGFELEEGMKINVIGRIQLYEPSGSYSIVIEKAEPDGVGGTLHQDIEHHWQDNPGQYTSQELVTKDQTVLQEIYGKTSRINSFHHQSIKDLAAGLEVIARDPKDGVIEAVQSTDESRFLGVQWHPELRFDKSPADHKLFEYVVNDL